MTGPEPLRCHYFDGTSTRRHEAVLAVHDGHAVVTGPEVSRTEPLVSVRVSERMGAAARIVSFTDGAFCEVHDHAALDRLLGGTGYREPLVARLQSRWTMTLGAVLVLVAVVGFTYLELLPWAAKAAAEHVPASAVESMSTRTLELLEGRVLEPTALPAGRRDAIRTRFDRLVPPDGDRVEHRVIFRAAPAIGPNAFALPSGTIIVTDALVELTNDDDEILAVLAHELGHVQGRHGVRLALQSSAVGVFLAWYFGDVSSLLATAPAMLLQASYSRDLEREADAYAARMLRHNGMGPRLLAVMLRRLEAAHGAEPRSADGDRDKPGAAGYLARHPATAERIRTLEAL